MKKRRNETKSRKAHYIYQRITYECSAAGENGSVLCVLENDADETVQKIPFPLCVKTGS
jgi:hypothetical protein